MCRTPGTDWQGRGMRKRGTREGGRRVRDGWQEGGGEMVGEEEDEVEKGG